MLLKLLAKLLAYEPVADWIIQRAMNTPYFHLPGYMHRWWFFNGYNPEDKIRPHWWCPWAMRVHWILRADLDKWPHDHPADCRTFILKNWYAEQRDDGVHLRQKGDTASIKFGEFHNIVYVPPEGVWTLFLLGTHKGTWSFRVNGKRVPWYDYLRSRDDPRDSNERTS